MIDHVAAVAEESRRFEAAVEAASALAEPLDAIGVPACPDWTLDDLVWHLSEVQHFWGSIVGDGLSGPQDYDRMERPGRDELLDLFRRNTARLQAAITDGDDDTPCWSWYDQGQHLGWVRRRQAQEALIHRVDAEQAVAGAGGPAVGTVDAELAADGIDEALRVMFDAIPPPPWGTWRPDGRNALLVATDVEVDGRPRSWSLGLGRVTGTDDDGVDHDLPAVEVREGAGTEAGSSPTVIRTGAAELDLWLWGRGQLSDGAVSGDEATVDWLAQLSSSVG